MQEQSLVKKADLQKGHPAILRAAKDVNLQVQADVDFANEVLGKLNYEIKELKEKQLKISRPINLGLANLRELFKEVNQPLLDAYDILDRKVMAWRRAKIAKIDAENERLRLENEEKNKKIMAEQVRRLNIQKAHERRGHETTQLEEAVYETAPQVPDLKHSDSTQVRLDWTWELEDIRYVERKHLVLDTIEIGKLVRGGIREIKGIRIYQKERRLNQRQA